MTTSIVRRRFPTGDSVYMLSTIVSPATRRQAIFDASWLEIVVEDADGTVMHDGGLLEYPRAAEPLVTFGQSEALSFAVNLECPRMHPPLPFGWGKTARCHGGWTLRPGARYTVRTAFLITRTPLVSPDSGGTMVRAAPVSFTR